MAKHALDAYLYAESRKVKAERKGKQMFKKKEKNSLPEPAKPTAKPTPAFLREDYPYKAMGDPITDLDGVEENSVYEIKCGKCEMSIRSQGKNIKGTYDRLSETGCIGCGNKHLVIRKVDMSAAS